MRSIDEVLREVEERAQQDREERPWMPASALVGEAQMHLLDRVGAGTTPTVDGLSAETALVVAAMLALGDEFQRDTDLRTLLSNVPGGVGSLPSFETDDELFLAVVKQLATSLLDTGTIAASDDPVGRLTDVLADLLEPVKLLARRAQDL